MDSQSRLTRRRHISAEIIDFGERKREQSRQLATRDGTVLGVLPIPGADTALVIVGHMVPLTEAHQAMEHQAGIPAAQPFDGPGSVADGIVVDRDSRQVFADGEEIKLTYREFELLDYLRCAPGRVYNRRQLLAAVWDRYGDHGARTVDVHVLRLRRKLGHFGDHIVTVRNVGYKYQP